MTSLVVSQVGLPVAARLKTSLDVSAHMLAMEAHHYNLPIEQYYRRVGEHLGVECPSNSSEVRQRVILSDVSDNGSQLPSGFKELKAGTPVASLRRREAQSDAETIGEKQPSGNGLQDDIRTGQAIDHLHGNGTKSLRDLHTQPAADKAVIPNRVSLCETFSYPAKVKYCSQIGIESLLYNLKYGAVKPRFVNIPEIPESERTKENVMAHLESLAEKGVIYLPAACTNHSATGKCQGHPTKETKA